MLLCSLLAAACLTSNVTQPTRAPVDSRSGDIGGRVTDTSGAGSPRRAGHATPAREWREQAGRYRRGRAIHLRGSRPRRLRDRGCAPGIRDDTAGRDSRSAGGHGGPRAPAGRAGGRAGRPWIAHGRVRGDVATYSRIDRPSDARCPRAVARLHDQRSAPEGPRRQRARRGGSRAAPQHRRSRPEPDTVVESAPARGRRADHVRAVRRQRELLPSSDRPVRARGGTQGLEPDRLRAGDDRGSHQLRHARAAPRSVGRRVRHRR